MHHKFFVSSRFFCRNVGLRLKCDQLFNTWIELFPPLHQFVSDAAIVKLNIFVSF